MKEGGTRRDHYKRAAKKGNAWAIAQLKPPTFPEPLRYLWEDYQELSNGCVRFDHLGRLEAITWVDAQAWMQIMRRPVQPFEMIAILQLDAVMRAAMAEDDSKDT